MKIIKVMPGKPAKKGAAAVATYKVVTFVRKGGKKLIVIPIAAGGGLAPVQQEAPLELGRRARDAVWQPCGPRRDACDRHAAEDRSGGCEHDPQRRGRHREHQHPGDRVRLGLVDLPGEGGGIAPAAPWDRGRRLSDPGRASRSPRSGA